jgi:hypothetical protein
MVSTDAYIHIHHFLMAIAWELLVPASIFVSRYLKTRLGHNWFRLHSLLAFLTFACTLSGFIVIEVTFDEGIPYQSAHVILGLIVFIGMFLQIILGLTIHFLYKADRTVTPWYDQLHWWSGRVLLIVSWVAIPMGVWLYSDYDINTQLGALIGHCIGYLVVILVFIWGEWKFGPWREGKQGGDMA